MAIPQQLNAQRDFSAGELDPEAKRRDDLPIMRAGGRQVADWRIRNTGVLEQRPGRRARYLQGGRVDQVSVLPGATGIYDLCFGADGTAKVRNSTGAVIASSSGYLWTAATIDQIVWTRVKTGQTASDVVITFPGMRPLVASFDGIAGWAFGTFAFSQGADGIALVPYYRVAAPGATLQPSATVAAGAAVNLTFSASVLSFQHLGTLMRFANRRLLITGVSDSVHATATAIDAMLPCQQMAVSGSTGPDPVSVAGYAVGQIVEGSISNCKGEVVAVDVPGKNVFVQITNFASGFQVNEQLVGPGQNSKITAIANVAPYPAVSWDEQMISAARGWPQSCSTDQGRLIFCDLPSTPEGIIWSSSNQPYNFNVGFDATSAFVELITGKPRVYHVMPWIDEIVFTDRGLYYIPIAVQAPLVPGSVVFQHITPEAASQVRPIFTSEGFLFVNAGRNRVVAVLGTGAAFSTRPYLTRDATEWHSHLFKSPKALAISNGDGTFPERYVYVVNVDGSVVMGRYEAAKEWVGWVPWSTRSGLVNWVSTLFADVMFTTTYTSPSTRAAVAEVMDAAQYLDAAIPINAVPSAIAPAPGLGPLWWLPNASVALMDGVMSLGTHTVNGNGFITPLYPGEELTSPTLVAGLPFTPTFEPFLPNAQPGQDTGQRMRRRSLGRVAITVKDSTGFFLANLYSSASGAGLPAFGAAIGGRRVTAWNQDENQAVAPPLREQTYTFRTLGRSYDPRIAVIKDTPGPLKIIEFGSEVSV